MAGEAVFALVVLLAVAAPFVLYALVQREREDREVMDRDAAERVARRDTREDRGTHDAPPPGSRDRE